MALGQMERSSSILEKRRIAAQGCQNAGYVQRTLLHRQCIGALIARDLQRTRDRAERLTQQAAQRHGICMQKVTFEIGRCIEI